jgi:hypothetical protein
MGQAITSINPGFEEKMDHKPLVSVITPFYNTSPEFLEEVIRSVFSQTYENWELLPWTMAPRQNSDCPSTICNNAVGVTGVSRWAAFMPSKLTGILAAGGTAIITADEDTELGRLVRNNRGIAVLVPPENQGFFQKALQAELSKEKNCAGSNLVARNYAERCLATDGILSQFEKALTAGIMR